MNSYFNGQKINLKKHLITVKESENSNEELYMPAEEFLTFLNFNVQWNKNDNALYLTMGQSNELNPNDGINNISINEADSKAIELIQNTGNWGYIEKYLPDMSEDGIKQVVQIYNSKHINKSEHKKASDYLHK